MKYIQLFQKKVIYRDDNKPYLVRWNLFGIGKDSSFFSVKIHNILVSDDACMHDHPWAFLSIILKGSYVETAKMVYRNCLWGWPEFDGSSLIWVMKKKFGAGRVLYRPANWVHKLEVVKPVWTLVFTFKKIKKWGFFTHKGWIYWKQYSKERDC